VNQTEFSSLHRNCIVALRDYVTAAEVTATMLSECTPGPMPLAGRLNILLQERAEDRAHSIYLDLKRLLHDAARLGYACSN
jgi:hypothetical protein